jgi:hypothetical protein
VQRPQRWRKRGTARRRPQAPRRSRRRRRPGASRRAAAASGRWGPRGNEGREMGCASRSVGVRGVGVLVDGGQTVSVSYCSLACRKVARGAAIATGNCDPFRFNAAWNLKS